MKLTKNKLKELIAEELKNIIQEDVTNEGPVPGLPHRQRASVPIGGGGGTPAPPGEGEMPPEQALAQFKEFVGQPAAAPKFNSVNAVMFPHALAAVLSQFTNPAVKGIGTQGLKKTAMAVIDKVFGSPAV